MGSSPIGSDPLLSSAINTRPAASRPASAHRTSEPLVDSGVAPGDSGVVQGEVPHGATLHGEANSDEPDGNESLPRADTVEPLASRLRRNRWWWPARVQGVAGMMLVLAALVVNEDETDPRGVDEMDPHGVKTGASGLKGVCARGASGADAGAG
jgi:hypothetical protein